MFVRLHGVRQISKTLNLMAGQGWVLISSNRSRCLYSDVANRSFISCKQSLKQCYHLKFIDEDVGKVYEARRKVQWKSALHILYDALGSIPSLTNKNQTKQNRTPYLDGLPMSSIPLP